MVLRAARSWGGALGLVGGGERDQEPVVDLGVEDGDADAVGGEHVVVGVRDSRRTSPARRSRRRS